MDTRQQKPELGLPEIRGYVYLVVGSVVALSVVLILYLLWQDSIRHRLEEAANRFHLESILHTVHIKDELHHLDRPLGDEGVFTHNGHAERKANALYVINRHLGLVHQLHAEYGRRSPSAALIDSTLRKADAQFRAIQALHPTRGTGPSDIPGAHLPMLVTGFSHSIEQLRRLHVLARDDIHSELGRLNEHINVRLLVIFAAAALLGLVVVWKTLAQIRQLIEAQKETESQLRQSAAVFENASEGVLITDTDANIVAVNRAFTEITGYAEADVLGKNPRILQSGRHDRQFYADMWSTLLEKGKWKGEISGRRKNGELFPKWQTITGVRDENGTLTHYVSVFSDISHIKESEEQLQHLAHHDPLTGLPNRLLLLARLEHSLQHAGREDQHVGVMFLDLDHFKKINDSFGHPVGDQLLKMVAARLLSAVRKDDTVARLGGDELTVILGSLKDSNYAATAAKHILGHLAEPFRLQGQDVFVSASIGISIYPRDGKDATTLLKNADTAMYMAKNAGRQRYHFYSQDLTDKAYQAFTLESQLHRAIEREELHLHYQPQVSLRDGRIVGVEALLRWRHPDLGWISPDTFIPLAEENGLICPIGKWVLHTACTQAQAWKDQGLLPLRMAINLSGKQLQRPDIVDQVRETLENTGLAARHLELELTESSVMAHADQAAATLDALRALGITIAIDDFGTGYSSLAYLKRFPLDRLKIDRSFVRDMPQDSDDVALARAIIALAQSLNLQVIAEGVETESQKALLASMGCEEMQGFLFARPETPDGIAKLLRGTAQKASRHN